MQPVERTFRFMYPPGLHARAAAMAVQKAFFLQKAHNVQLYIRRPNSEPTPLSSLLILLTLKLRAGERLSVGALGKNAQIAVDEMIDFLSGDFHLTDDASMRGVDSLLQNNASTAEKIFNSIATGLIVINEYNVITLFNPMAEKTFGLPSASVIGKNISDVIPGTGLEQVNQFGKQAIGVRQKVGRSIIVKSSTPIIADNGSPNGAVCAFENISRYVKISWQLKEICELKEKYKLILESMQEGICVLDANGIINYVNPSYLKILNTTSESIIGKNIYEISPDGARCQTLKSGKMITGYLTRKTNGTTLMATVCPIIMDGEISGVVSVINNVTELQELMEKLNKTIARAEYLENELQRTKERPSAFKELVGGSGKITDAIAIAEKAAKGIYTVLIRGESGTGKELFAEAIHSSSPRSAGPFIRVNCAAIPSSLMESELFGHEKDAFTGTVKAQMGKFELADKGTLFLDEIGNIEKDMQVKLLRFIQSNEFQRVDGRTTIHVDVKIIAATNRNPEKMVQEGLFREDLYYRLNVIPICLPALRERKEDIPQMADAFLKRISGELGKQIVGIRNETLQAMLCYDWPGNIRELENVMERTITLLEGEWIEPNDLPQYIRDKADPAKRMDDKLSFDEEPVLRWEDYEKRIIQKAIHVYGSYNAAGKALGLTHKTVSSKVKKYGLEKAFP